jgi:DNA polymerase III sliding clamp (beta) subunit (PCNA family)
MILNIENRRGTHTYVTNEHVDELYEFVIDKDTPNFESLIEKHVKMCNLERTIEITAPMTGQMLYAQNKVLLRSSRCSMAMIAITHEMFELYEDWSFKNEESRNMIRFSTIIEGDDSYTHCHYINES